MTPKLLFADDCLEDRETYRRYLLRDQQRTYNIFEAETGEETLLLCQQQVPDVVLLDYLLPDMDGLEILSQLKTQFGQTKVPVIILTGQGNEQIAVQAMKSGAADYLVKRDTTSESLIFAIQNLLERDVCLEKFRISCGDATPTAETAAPTFRYDGLRLGKQEEDEIRPREFFTLVENTPKSLLAIDTDITDKKQVEAQFERTQRLESLGILVSGIAHDLSNILTPILIAAQLLPLKLPNCDEQNRQLLKILEDNSQHGVELVRQILSYARGTEGKRVSLQVKHLLKEIERIVKGTFPKSIEIRTNVPTEGIWTVSANFTQLHQVLMNLCVNARDAMPDGGTLTICAENFFVDKNYARMYRNAKVGKYVVLTVSDTGYGIPKELLERIFEPFFTTKELDNGTGLGLSTVTSIIRNYGGFVKVYSEINKGSQFQVFLPAHDTKQG